MNQTNDKYFIALSDHLKQLMELKGIDISDLAAAANLDRKQIYRFLNKENIPKLSTIVKISLAAGIEPQQLFDFKFNFKAYMAENNIFPIKDNS